MSSNLRSAQNSSLRIALCQIDIVVGDLEGNATKIVDALKHCEQQGCDVAVFAELSTCGYPPEDLLFKQQFVDDNRDALVKIASETSSCVAVVGFVDQHQGQTFNAAAICANGKVQAVYRKHHLPNYNVFDEKRYFTPGTELPLLRLGDATFGVTICEDLWADDGPFDAMAQGGAQLIININASPYHQHKLEEREELISRRVSENRTPLAYVNLVGAQDELIFDGASVIVDHENKLIARSEQFKEQILIADVELTEPKPVTLAVTEIIVRETKTEKPENTPTIAPLLEPLEEIWQALVLGIRDYVHNNGFEQICLGLSGGIDSAITAALAVDALGAANVHPVMMPSRYSSEHSLSDAVALCERLGVEPLNIAIEPAHQAFTDMLKPEFSQTNSEPGDLTDQNLQSRIRGVTLMALANQLGWLVMTTGNKTELAVGYSTLYGDTAGAYAAIKDVWKLQVYDLARDFNARAGSDVIPNNILTKAPSAELKPDQRDDDSLPPYEKLDPLLFGLVELDKTATEMTAEGYDAETASRIARMVDNAEFKREQSPLGTRITKRAFGKDRRMPTTHHYRG